MRVGGVAIGDFAGVDLMVCVGFRARLAALRSECDLGAEHGGQANSAGCFGEANDAVEAVVVVSASASRPRRDASSASCSGWLAPSRNEKLLWQCSSAYGTCPVSGRMSGRVMSGSRVGSKGCRLRLSAGPSPPPFHDGLPGARPSFRRARSRPESSASTSPQGISGLLKPIRTRDSSEHTFVHARGPGRGHLV